MLDPLPESLVDATERLYRRAGEFLRLLERLEPAAGEAERNPPVPLTRPIIDDVMALDESLRGVEPESGLLPTRSRWGVRQLRTYLNALADRWGIRQALGPGGSAYVDERESWFAKTIERPYVEALVAYLDGCPHRPEDHILKQEAWARLLAASRGYPCQLKYKTAAKALDRKRTRFNSAARFGTGIAVASHEDVVEWDKAIRDIEEGIEFHRTSLLIERSAPQRRCPPAASSVADTGATQPSNENELAQQGAGPPAKHPSFTPPSRGGRPPDTDAENDRRAAEAWQSKQYTDLADLGRHLGLSKPEVRRALDRHRKRAGKTSSPESSQEG